MLRYPGVRLHRLERVVGSDQDKDFVAHDRDRSHARQWIMPVCAPRNDAASLKGPESRQEMDGWRLGQLSSINVLQTNRITGECEGFEIILQRPLDEDSERRRQPN